MFHVKTKVNGKISRVDTFVGTEEDGFSHVGHTEGLDEPGVIDGYRDYSRAMRNYADGMIDVARGNMSFPLWGAKHGVYEVIYR